MEKYNTWNMYREEIQKEQKEYMLWAENQILNAKQSNQVELSPEARNFAEAHIQQKLQNIKKLPQHYFPSFPNISFFSTNYLRLSSKISLYTTFVVKY